MVPDGMVAPPRISKTPLGEVGVKTVMPPPSDTVAEVPVYMILSCDPEEEVFISMEGVVKLTSIINVEFCRQNEG